MEEQDPLMLSNTGGLLSHLALKLQKLCLKKNETQQQIHIYQEKITKKRVEMDRTKESIEKLEEELCHRQKLVTHFKDNIKSLRGANSLLLQFKHTLQEELQKREENYTQDMKMYEARTESYRKVFEQHKVQYCQNQSAQKLLKMQEQKEQIEQRLTALKEQVAAKEKELQTLHENACVDQIPTVPQRQSEEKSQLEGTDVLGENGSNSGKEEEVKMGNDDKEEVTGNEAAAPPSAMNSDTNLRDIDRDHSSIHPVGRLQECEVQKVNIKKGAGDKMRMRCTREQASHVAEENETDQRESYLQTTPIRMKAVSSTPTISLSGSPSHSLGGYEASESPGFMFAVHSAPDTPSFSGFDYTFNAESAQEDKHFYFSSSCFTDKKTSACKSTGFLFEPAGSRTEEEYDFSFSSSSPSQAAPGTALGEMGDNMPFSFTFGKFQ